MRINFFSRYLRLMDPDNPDNPDNTTVSGMQKVDARLAVTARGSIESSCGAHGTRPRIFERHQSGNTVATHNHFHQVWGAQMRMSCFSEGKAQQLPRIGRKSCALLSAIWSTEPSPSPFILFHYMISRCHAGHQRALERAMTSPCRSLSLGTVAMRISQST